MDSNDETQQQQQQHVDAAPVAQPPSSWWTALIPERNPVPWTVINAIFLAWSILTAFIILETFALNDRLEGTHYYLIWCSASCIVWTLEIALTIGHVHYHKRDATWSWLQILELVLAVYWSAESLLLLAHGRTTDPEIAWELLDVAIAIPAYAYVLYETWKMAKRQQQQQQQQQQELESSLAEEGYGAIA